MAKPKPSANCSTLFDRELTDLPPEARWREWMNRVEAAIFASASIVPRAVLAELVGKDAALDELIADIREELKARPYDLTPVAGGWQHRTRARYAEAIREAGGETLAEEERAAALTETEGLALCTIAYFQPVTRERISAIIGRNVSRDILARLKRLGLIGAGPRLPQLGAPLTYVTTPAFLVRAGLNSLRDLPDIEAMDGIAVGKRSDSIADKFAILDLEHEALEPHAID